VCFCTCFYVRIEKVGVQHDILETGAYCRVRTSVFLHMFLCTHRYVYLCTYIYIHIKVHRNIHTYIYMYIRIYIYIHIKEEVVVEAIAC